MAIKLYRVGGCVRDEYMGLDPHDIDFSVEASSYEEMEAWMIEKRFVIWQSRPEFLTIRARFPADHPQYSHLSADFVCCRSEGYYSDGRHPDDVSVGTVWDDLTRRDFTVNAIAIDVDTNEVIDPHNGRADIRQKVLRCVGTPWDRFHEDGLRVIRALRFLITKDFTFDQTLWDALESDWVVPLIENVKTDRRREELQRCFQHDTFMTLRVLEWFPHLHRAMFSGGIWLQPTTRSTRVRDDGPVSTSADS